MKKKALALLLVLCLMIQPAIHSEAKDKPVTIGSVSMTSDSAKVSGSTEAFAVMMKITDASGNIVSMQSFAVDADGNFFADITGASFADGTYTIAVADYEGGSWDTKTVTVGSTQSNDQPVVIYTPTDTPPAPTETPSTSPSPEPEQAAASTSEPSFEEIIKKEGSDTVTAVFDAGLIGEKEVEISVIPDPEDEEGAALLNALLTDEQIAASKNEPVEIILTISSSKLSTAEEKACDNSIESLEAMINDGKATDNNVTVSDELRTLFSGTLSTPSGETGKPAITIANTYEFKVSLKIGDNAPVEIHDLGTVKIAVNFLIDKKFRNTNPLILRIFFMLHLKSNGETEVLPVNVNANASEGSFEFDSCSPFILAYTDVANYTEAGTTLKSSKYNATYNVIKGGDTSGKVGVLEYTGPVKKKAKHIVHSRVTINNITYKVKSIAADAFKGNKTLEKITIGKYVTSIGANAFYGCTGLKTVTIGRRVSKIGDKAFCKAKALENVIIKSKKLKSKNIGASVWTKAGTSGSGITFTVPSSKLKSYKKLFGKAGTVEAE